MNWFNNISLKSKFVGLLAIIVALSLIIGAVMVKNVRGSTAMVDQASAYDTRALYAKELQVLLLKIDNGFRNLSDIDEGIEEAEMNMEIVRQTVAYLGRQQDTKPETQVSKTGSQESGHEMNHGAGHKPAADKGIHAGHVTDVFAYADSYEKYYRNAQEVAQQFSQFAKANPEKYFEQLDTLKKPISRDTDALMTHYVATASEHTSRANGMLAVMEKLSIGLLALQAVVISLATLMIMRGCDQALKNIRKVINEIIDQGWNLTLKLEEKGADEFSQISGMFNKFIERLRETLLQVRESTASISLSADDIRNGNDRLAERNAEQAASLEETASSMEEMTSIVQSNSENAGEVAGLADSMRETAESSGNIIQQAVTSMEDIRESAAKMAEIIAVVDGISFQTNLLALNAAVEAARAGDQGRGFSVVAGEVRELAQRSAHAAKEVKSLIDESSARVEAGAALVNRSGNALQEIISSVEKVHEIIARLAAASEEQAEGIEQVNQSVSQMDDTTQRNTHLAEEIANASLVMYEQTDKLREMVSTFTLVQEMDSPGNRALADSNTPNLQSYMSGLEKAANDAGSVRPRIVSSRNRVST